MTTWKGEAPVTSWDEDTFVEMEDGRKLTRASVTQKFTGDLEGTGRVDWLMCYADDGTAHYVGLQRIESTVKGQEGSIVLESNGAFDGKVASGTLSVIPRSGTGKLARLRGEGKFEAPHGGTPTWTLDAMTD
jgi:hypothetical protein